MSSNPDGIARNCLLPNDEFAPAWKSIMLAEGIRERLLAQSLSSFTVRQKLPFESAPLHGLILLTGAPGTGKTTLARGLALQISFDIPVHTQGLLTPGVDSGHGSNDWTVMARPSGPRAASIRPDEC